MSSPAPGEGKLQTLEGWRFALCIVALSLSVLTFIGIPFAVFGFIFVTRARRELSAVVAQRNHADHWARVYGADLESTRALAARVGAWDVREREMQLRSMDEALEARRREADVTMHAAAEEKQKIIASAEEEAAQQRQTASDILQKAEMQREAILAETQRQKTTLIDEGNAEAVRLRSEAEAVLSEAKKERVEMLSLAEEQLGELKSQIEQSESDFRNAEAALSTLRDEVLDLRATADMNDFGLYDFENPAEDSLLVAEELKEVQESIKFAVRTKNAVSATRGFILNDSKRQGEKLVADMSKLLLRAFNAEAENCVKTVKAGRLSVARERLNRSAAAVARLGTGMDIQITDMYLELRKRELELTHKHMEAVKALKEEERLERERQRDEARARKEFEEAKRRQLAEVAHFRAAFERLRDSGDAEGAQEVEMRLDRAEERLSDIEDRMADTRAGHVYVISNVGSFGRGVVKIGMTRRMTPEDRVRELGDASVPFLFDQHAMIFSPDAYTLELKLHQYFAHRRVNLVNMRREYFYATPAEVKEALIEIGDAHVIEFREQWSAPEFTQSAVLRKERGLPEVPTSSLEGLYNASFGTKREG